MVKEADKTKIFLEFIDLNTNNSEDLKKIFHITGNDFEKLSFDAKCLKGLHVVLTKENISEDLKANSFSEFQTKLKEFINDLIEISTKMESCFRQSFESKYLYTDSNSFQNLFELIADLTVCKNYLNDLKNKSN